MASLVARIRKKLALPAIETESKAEDIINLIDHDLHAVITCIGSGRPCGMGRD
jgi:hypothetical protein